MPTFHYRAIQGNGVIAQGELEAGGRQDALRQIEGLGLRPIQVAERGGAVKSVPAGRSSAPVTGGSAKTRTNGSTTSPASSTPETTTRSTPRASTSKSGTTHNNPSNRSTPARPGSSTTPHTKDNNAGSSWSQISLGGADRISARILENFTRLLSSLLAAGVPLSRALTILNREAATPAAARQWKQVHDLVIDGLSLADAMSRSPKTFPKVYVAMVEAGETGGFLDVVLAQIADFQAREKELKSKVTTALLYPTILLVLAIGVLVFLLVFFIPRFQSIFSGFGASLPLLTQIIVSISEILRGYGLFIAGGIVVAAFGLRHWLVSEQGRRKWEGMILRAPVIGPLVAQFAMARFARMLGTLLNAGVPLINGLNVARRSIGNQILVDAVANSIDRVKEGKQLAPSLAECRDLFSGSTLEMISVAEESGKLDTELIRIANVTEGDLDRQLKTAVALAEPLMLFLIAGFIGTIFIGMVIPIFSLQDHIK